MIAELTVTLKELASDLSKKYGSTILVEDSEEFEEEEEEFYIPGSFVSASWNTEKFILYLAICQEDREYPITLAMGVKY